MSRYIYCRTIERLTGELWEGCCSSCHEDVDEGYYDSMCCADLGKGREADICCGALRSLEAYQKINAEAGRIEVRDSAKSFVEVSPDLEIPHYADSPLGYDLYVKAGEEYRLFKGPFVGRCAAEYGYPIYKLNATPCGRSSAQGMVEKGSHGGDS